MDLFNWISLVRREMIGTSVQLVAVIMIIVAGFLVTDSARKSIGLTARREAGVDNSFIVRKWHVTRSSSFESSSSSHVILLSRNRLAAWDRQMDIRKITR